MAQALTPVALVEKVRVTEVVGVLVSVLTSAISSSPVATTTVTSLAGCVFSLTVYGAGSPPFVIDRYRRLRKYQRASHLLRPDGSRQGQQQRSGQEAESGSRLWPLVSYPR